MHARIFGAALALAAFLCIAADWPQWRGPGRDGKASSFVAPATWPMELKQRWKVTVGDGVATPALVGEKLFVTSREGSDEILRCLDAATGKEIWQDKYAVRGADGPASGFAGPRSTPAVAAGKVVTLGVRGLLACYEADSGKKLWSKEEVSGWPMFYVSSSPLIVDGLAIAQLGGNNGALVAYELATGNQKWKVGDLPTSYASPVLMNVGELKLVIGQVSDGIVAINVADGAKGWEKFFDRGGSRYKAATPIVDGSTLIFVDGPARALKLEMQADKLVDKEVWANADSRVEYNTPVLKDGLLFGISQRNEFFCVRTADGKTAWSAAAPAPPAAAGGGGGGGGRGKGGGGGGGYGSVVDAGSVLIGLTPSAQLVIYEPTDKELKVLATYKVSDGQTYAYPIVTDKRIFIKDRDSVTLWTTE